jgi:hypothetical protein
MRLYQTKAKGQGSLWIAKISRHHGLDLQSSETLTRQGCVRRNTLMHSGNDWLPEQRDFAGRPAGPFASCAFISHLSSTKRYHCVILAVSRKVYTCLRSFNHREDSRNRFALSLVLPSPIASATRCLLWAATLEWKTITGVNLRSLLPRMPIIRLQPLTDAIMPGLNFSCCDAIIIIITAY